MGMVLNALASLLLLLLLLLRRSFTSLIESPATTGDPRHFWLRLLLGVTCAAAAVFATSGLWMLASNGYAPVAVFLAVVVALSVNAWRGRASRPSGPSERA